MSWKISKEFSFCFGHRVWTQKLEAAYCESGDASCKCKHLHGHEGLVRVHLSADSLQNNMVTDFKHLGWLKNFLDDVLDHKFVFDINDPMFNSIVSEAWKRPGWINTDMFRQVNIPGTQVMAGRSLNLDLITPNTPEWEVLEGYFVVDFVPTSENFSKWLFDIVQTKMNPLGVIVDAVEWWETPKSCSIYYGEKK